MAKNFDTEYYKFISHKDCEFFPCHKTNDPENFSCLFCYCPLYALGDKCGGNFVYNKKGIKDCTGCLVPHMRNNYEYINRKLREIIELVRKPDISQTEEKESN